MNTKPMVVTLCLDSSAHLCHLERDEDRCLVRLTCAEVLELQNKNVRLVENWDPNSEPDITDWELFYVGLSYDNIKTLEAYIELGWNEAPSTLDNWSELNTPHAWTTLVKVANDAHPYHNTFNKDASSYTEFIRLLEASGNGKVTRINENFGYVFFDDEKNFYVNVLFKMGAIPTEVKSIELATKLARTFCPHLSLIEDTKKLTDKFCGAMGYTAKMQGNPSRLVLTPIEESEIVDEDHGISKPVKIEVFDMNDGFKIMSNRNGGNIIVTFDGRIFYSNGFFQKQFASWEDLLDSGMARNFLD